jgi:hypothetical protein
MKRSDRKKVEAAADESIAKIRAARSATNEVTNGIAKQAAPADLQPLLDRVSATHDAAVKATTDLQSAVTSAEVESISQPLQSVVDKVRHAKSEADKLKNTPTQAQANATRDADDEAVTQLTDLKATLQTAPEMKLIGGFHLADLFGWFTQLTSQQAIGFAGGAALFAIVLVGLVELGNGIYGPQSLVEKLAKVENARGLITYILALGTMAIALVLVLAALLGGAQSAENFGRGKEVLTILIGVFGTILGFYYGSESAQRKAALEISPFVVAQSTDRTKTALFTTVSGGQPPYAYSLKFNNKNVHDLSDKSENGQISVNIDTGNIPPGEKVPFTLTVTDAAMSQISHESTETEKLSGKELVKAPPIPSSAPSGSAAPTQGSLPITSASPAPSASPSASTNP